MAEEDKKKKVSKFKHFGSGFLVASILFIFTPLTSIFDGFWRHSFCMPSAYLSSIFTGLPCTQTPEGYMLAHETLPVLITLSCSAANFFVLTVALISGLILKFSNRFRLKSFLWVIPLSYVITIAANVARIVMGWFAGRWARIYFPENFWSGIHLGVGVLVFLSFLVATYGTLIWRLRYDENR